MLYLSVSFCFKIKEEIYVEQMSSFAIIPSANYISGCVMEKMTVETTLTKPLTCVVWHFTWL